MVVEHRRVQADCINCAAHPDRLSLALVRRDDVDLGFMHSNERTCDRDTPRMKSRQDVRSRSRRCCVAHLVTSLARSPNDAKCAITQQAQGGHSADLADHSPVRVPHECSLVWHGTVQNRSYNHSYHQSRDVSVWRPLRFHGTIGGHDDADGSIYLVPYRAVASGPEILLDYSPPPPPPPPTSTPPPPPATTPRSTEVDFLPPFFIAAIIDICMETT